MKRAGNLWDGLCSADNAIRAIIQGTENKRKDSLVRRKLGYTDTLPEHEGKLNPVKVQKYAEWIISLLEHDWRPMPMRHITIHPTFGKSREIDCPTLSDHVVHWMLMLTIQPAIMRGMYAHSYGSIPDKGIDGARRSVERWVQHDDKAKYFVKLDIRKFYPSINQEMLKESFRRIIKDPDVLGLLDKVISVIPQGVPIGAYTSQWLANFFLQPLDHHIVQDIYKKRRDKRLNLVAHYLRYMDDMLLIGKSKRDLEKAVREVITFAKTRLCLDIKPCWEIRRIAEDGNDIAPGVAPVDIVGYRFYRNHTEARGSIFLHTSRLAAKIKKRLEQRCVVMLFDAQGIVSLCGWFEHADSEWFYEHYISDRINYKLMTEVISYASKNGIVGETACIYCRKNERSGQYHILFGRSRGPARRYHGLDSGCLDYGVWLDGEP